MLKKWIFWRSVQIFIDFWIIYIAFLLAYFFRVGWIFSSDFPFPLFAFMTFLASLVWVAVLMVSKYYRIPPRGEKRVFFDFLLVFLSGALASSVLIVLYFFPQNHLFSRLISLYAFVAGSLFLLISQQFFRFILAQQKKQNKNIYRTLIIGANRVSEKIIQAIEKDKYAPYKIIGVIDPYGLEKSIGDFEILGKLDKLEFVCKQQNITAIIQCDAFEHTLNIISFCEAKNIKFQFDPALRGIFEENLRIREVAGQTMISFVKRDFEDPKKQKFFRWGDIFLRQVFDID